MKPESDGDANCYWSNWNNPQRSRWIENSRFNAYLTWNGFLFDKGCSYNNGLFLKTCMNLKFIDIYIEPLVRRNMFLFDKKWLLLGSICTLLLHRTRIIIDTPLLGLASDGWYWAIYPWLFLVSIYTLQLHRTKIISDIPFFGLASIAW